MLVQVVNVEFDPILLQANGTNYYGFFSSISMRR